MITKLREYPSDEELRQLYAEKHDHTRWPDHVIRVDATVALARWMSDGVASSFGLTKCKSVADLSCGDGAILDALDIPAKFYGDFVPGYPICGKLEDTIHGLPTVDMFINCETLEHVAEPLDVLQKIRRKSRRLVLTTPIGVGADSNKEHVWSWDVDGVQELLAKSDWTVKVRQEIRFFHWAYNWQIWGCA